MSPAAGSGPQTEAKESSQLSYHSYHSLSSYQGPHMLQGAAPALCRRDRGAARRHSVRPSIFRNLLHRGDAGFPAKSTVNKCSTSVAEEGTLFVLEHGRVSIQDCAPEADRCLSGYRSSCLVCVCVCVCVSAGRLRGLEP